MIQKDEIVREIWGNYCPECEFKQPPKVQFYQLENEQVIVLSCLMCDFTIVVVDLESNTKTKRESREEGKQELIVPLP